MPQLTYSSSQSTDIIEINRLLLDDWATVGLSMGLSNDNWSFEVFGDNVTNEKAPTGGNFVNDRELLTK